MEYAVIANGEFNNAIWYGTYDDLETANNVADTVNGKVVIWNNSKQEQQY